MNDLQNKIKNSFQAAQRVLITSHIRPDGDAIGSNLALGLALLDLGKQVQMVLADGAPDMFRHLPGSQQIQTQASGDFDLIVCVDCSDLKRVGSSLDGYRAPDIVIDHHATNQAFGNLNLIDPLAAATASVLTRYMPDWGLKITTPVADNLLTGIITDTLGFRTSNTNAEVLRQAADLMDLGADMNKLYFRGLVSRSFSAARYWGAGLSRLERQGGIVWTELTLPDRQTCEYTGNDDADLITVLSAIDDADVAIIFVEQNENETKVSWRSLKPDLDVSQVASQFGGGGHKAAAGADISASLPEVRKRVLEATREMLHLPI